MMRCSILVIVLLGGCASGSFDRLPRQDEAATIIWNQLYGEDGDPPPVEWIDGEAAPGASGVTLPGWKVRVSRCDSTQADAGQPLVTRYFSGTAMAHEFMHMHTFNRTGDVDTGHYRGDWELVDNGAFDALWNEGL